MNGDNINLQASTNSINHAWCIFAGFGDNNCNPEVLYNNILNCKM